MVDKKIEDLGWANSWTNPPPILDQCKAQGHRKADIDIGAGSRGFEHVACCHICGFVYHYDSSD